MDGLSTAFWEDRWLSMGTLKDLFPLLYTHATTKDITVAMAVEGGLERYLVPRLTARAAAELEQLRQILTRVRLRPPVTIAEARHSAMPRGCCALDLPISYPWWRQGRHRATFTLSSWGTGLPRRCSSLLGYSCKNAYSVEQIS